MKFGIHNSSWVDSPDPAEAFEAAKGETRDRAQRQLFAGEARAAG